jgi:hypothetical protein
MARKRFVDPGKLRNLIKSDLHRIITIVLDGLLLYDHTWSRFHNRDRDDNAILPEYLRHAKLLADNSDAHPITS